MKIKNQIEVKATATPEQINLNVTHNYNDTHTELFQGVLRLQEEKVREALKSLGWTPPEEAMQVKNRANALFREANLYATGEYSSISRDTVIRLCNAVDALPDPGCTNCANHEDITPEVHGCSVSGQLDPYYRMEGCEWAPIKPASKYDMPPHQVHGITQCGTCGAVFDNLNMSLPCPECGEALTYGCTAETFTNAFADAQALDMLVRDNPDMIVDLMFGLDMEYNPDATGQARLTRIEEED